MKILVDSREQAPYTFARYADVVAEPSTLQTGDYSLCGLQDRIGLERKSIDDLTGTLTKGRDRFTRECERGRGFDYFGLIIEASLEDVRGHKYQSAMGPQSLLQSLATFSVRYGLHVHWCGNRAGGEYMTHAVLSKYLREAEKRLAAIVRAHGDVVDNGRVIAF
jgi:ERCC4-type nuclease